MYKESGIALIDLHKNEDVALWPFHPRRDQFAVTFSRDKTRLAYTGQSAIIIWDILTKRRHWGIPDNGHMYSHLAFSHDGTLLAGSWTKSGKSGVHIWECDTRQRKLDITNASVETIAFLEDRSLIGVGSGSSRGGFWNVRGIYRIASVANISPGPELIDPESPEEGERYPNNEVCI
jgi:hypothetical protein